MNIPQEWKDVLEKVQTQFPNAVIAGGCLRDLDYGLVQKDVDIFIPTENYMTINALDAIEGLFGAANNTFENFDTLYDAVRDINLVMKYELDGVDYDIIFIDVRDSDKVMDTFDFSVCQAEFDGKQISTSVAYVKTKNTFIITNTRYDVETYEARCERLLEKFPAFTIEELT